MFLHPVFQLITKTHSEIQPNLIAIGMYLEEEFQGTLNSWNPWRLKNRFLIRGLLKCLDPGRLLRISDFI